MAIILSFGYILKCVDDKFSQLFKSCLGENAVKSFVNSVVEESRQYIDIIKNLQ